MLLQSSPLFNSVVEWNLRVVVCHSFAVKRPDRTSALAQVKKTAARVLCIFTWQRSIELQTCGCNTIASHGTAGQPPVPVPQPNEEAQQSPLGSPQGGANPFMQLPQGVLFLVHKDQQLEFKPQHLTLDPLR